MISDLRLKYLTLLMVIVLSISCVITFLRFGVGFLEDNFVSRLSTHYTSSAQFMAFYGLLNFYLYTMAYVYSPGNSSAHGKYYHTVARHLLRRMAMICRNSHFINIPTDKKTATPKRSCLNFKKFRLNIVVVISKLFKFRG